MKKALFLLVSLICINNFVVAAQVQDVTSLFSRLCSEVVEELKTRIEDVAGTYLDEKGKLTAQYKTLLKDFYDEHEDILSKKAFMSLITGINDLKDEVVRCKNKLNEPRLFDSIKMAVVEGNGYQRSLVAIIGLLALYGALNVCSDVKGKLPTFRFERQNSKKK